MKQGVARGEGRGQKRPSNGHPFSWSLVCPWIQRNWLEKKKKKGIKSTACCQGWALSRQRSAPALPLLSTACSSAAGKSRVQAAWESLHSPGTLEGTGPCLSCASLPLPAAAFWAPCGVPLACPITLGLGWRQKPGAGDTVLSGQVLPLPRSESSPTAAICSEKLSFVGRRMRAKCLIVCITIPILWQQNVILPARGRASICSILCCKSACLAVALKQLQLFILAANLSHGHIQVNESRDFPNLRDYCYSDEDVTDVAVLVEVLGAQERFAIFYLWVVCVETLSCREEVVCGDKEDTERIIWELEYSRKRISTQNWNVFLVKCI